MTRPARRRLPSAAVSALLVATGVLAVVLGGVPGARAWVHRAPSVLDTCRAVAAASAVRHAEVVGKGSRVVVIGDSYAQGAHLADPVGSWPSMLPGRVVVDGFAGSGFTAGASPCPGEAFGSRVARALAEHPALVVLQGGLNDFDVPDGQLRAGVREVLARLSGHPVVVVGPPDAPSRASQVARVDGVLADETSRAGVPYVRTSGWQLPYLPDRLHLTAEGHRVFGAAVAVRVAGLAGGLADRSG